MSLRTKRPVLTEVAARYGNTMALTFASLVWSTVVGVILGVWSGKNRGKWQDFTGMTLAVSGISLPNFWIGFLLIMAFSVKLRWFPTTGVGSWKNLVLPAIALGTSIAAIIARFTRSSIVEVLKEDYIRTPGQGTAGEDRDLGSRLPQFHDLRGDRGGASVWLSAGRLRGDGGGVCLSGPGTASG